jgi:CzcA family heavy metal efflux pump
MLNTIIRLSLTHRLAVMALALATIVFGSIVASSLPIDVLPDLNRPRVVLVTECPGLAPEEVEQRVTFPLETAVNGANGVIAVRSASDIGLSVVNIEFDWGTDIYTARQIVQERVATVQSRMPAGIDPQIGPISSLLGQIMLVGLWSESGEASPLELRTIADWQVRQALLTIPGISQVITMGGGRKQYHVLADIQKLHKYDVPLQQLERALADSNLNVTGGYLDRGSREMPIRGIGRIQSIDDIRKVAVKRTAERPVLVENLATVAELPQVKRGDSSVNGREAVVITIQKQPDADTRRLTREIVEMIDNLRPSLPKDVVIDPTLYQQREFIDHGIRNVVEALRDGTVLVVIVLFLFLFNMRTTFITLTAIPLSILTTALVFRYYGLSINVMTLGGIAVALGELVDDAIVDVENIYRRLGENLRLERPRPVLEVIFTASSEVRRAIFISTVLVVVVFAPLFALSGMEGRLFMPLGIAYVVSILASTVVSLTVTPVLSYYLLARRSGNKTHQDSWLLRVLKAALSPVIRWSMSSVGFVAVSSVALISVCASVLVVAAMGKNFLPPFDEGAAQVNLFTPPGTSLETSKQYSKLADREFAKLLASDKSPENSLLSFTCRTGRAELDEHVMGVNISEYVMTLNPKSPLNREQLIARLSDAVDEIPGVETEVEQPIAHLISHMLSGVTAQIAIKIYGDNLELLRNTAEEVKHAIEDVAGIAEPVVEQQQLVPQLRIELLRDRLASYGASARDVHEFVETAMNGRVVTQVVEGEQVFDLLLRIHDDTRNDVDQLPRMPIELPGGECVPLAAVARVYQGAGPNTISRENAKRCIVVRVNTRGRDLAGVVTDIENVLRENVELPKGYFVTMGGQFEAQQEATRRIVWLSVLAIMVVFGVLYSNFRSLSLVSQILIALPTAFVGGTLALVLTGQDLSVAAMVGFISLGGIAARNGLLLVSTYLDLSREQGFSRQSLLQGSLSRLAPVLMTSLTTGLGLIPLVIGGQQPGKEILFPVATVILGGIITSTMCEFLLRPGMFWYLTPKRSLTLQSES